MSLDELTQGDGGAQRATVFFDGLMRVMATPHRTFSGEVLAGVWTVDFGFARGPTRLIRCHAYRHHGSGLQMLVGVQDRVTPKNLVARVFDPAEALSPTPAVSVQFNGGLLVVEAPDGEMVLRHHGRFSQGSPIGLGDMIEAIACAAPEAAAMLGGLSDRDAWPRTLGSLRNVGRLLDEMFLYCYCVEQGKRLLREDTALRDL